MVDRAEGEGGAEESRGQRSRASPRTDGRLAARPCSRPIRQADSVGLTQVCSTQSSLPGRAFPLLTWKERKDTDKGGFVRKSPPPDL